MRSSFFLTLAGLFAAANSLFTGQNEVVDGSFEDVPRHSLGVHNARAGGWRLKDAGYFQANSAALNPRYNTPYGTQYVAFSFDTFHDYTHGSAAQDLAGLTDGTYTYHYYYKNRLPFSRDCVMNSTYGSQFLDSVLLPADGPNPPPVKWTARSISFTPEQPAGTLKIVTDCGRGTAGRVGAFFLDNVSIVGRRSMMV